MTHLRTSNLGRLLLSDSRPRCTTQYFMPRNILCGSWSLTRSTFRPQLRSQTLYTLRLASYFATNPRTNFQKSAGLLNLSERSRIQSYIHPKHKMSTSTPDRYKLVFFVPTANVEACKDAIFATGAGSFPGGKYTKVCFQTVGTGQFLPGNGAVPAVGTVGALERCEEVRVEIMCLGRGIMLNAVDALVSAHPYEQVAYEVYKMENV
ncbi:unnamed protein product [Penicillium egyptiacum]|uniref:ATP phosphoribosyltransferase n=1 Tax=Penicillium egyptiacum TaxID=1303716 RepID=A0A9W4P3F1_9EURO|nr:unnamed protein product [Penicillium egyptiacum]